MRTDVRRARAALSLDYRGRIEGEYALYTFSFWARTPIFHVIRRDETGLFVEHDEEKKVRRLRARCGRILEEWDGQTGERRSYATFVPSRHAARIGILCVRCAPAGREGERG